MAARKNTQDRDLKPLFRAVYAKPTDDTRRLVLGDALLEAGDPRGELISESQRRLQKGSATPSKKERALLATHGETWLGPLAAVLRQPTWHLGFVSGGVLAGGRELGDRGVDDVAGCLEWATVERLRFWPEHYELNEQVLGFDHLPSLKSVGSVFAESIAAVAKQHGPRGWTELTNIPDHSVDSPGGGWDTLATLARALPKLEVLTLAGSGMMDFSFEELEPLLTSRLVARLKRLELQTSDVRRLFEFALTTTLEQVRCKNGGTFSLDLVTRTATVPPGFEEEVSSLRGVKVVTARSGRAARTADA
jgi:uncharacterized protein (TIGR02996 family)